MSPEFSVQTKERIKKMIEENRRLQDSRFSAILSVEQSTLFDRYLNFMGPVRSEVTLLQ